MVRRSGRIALLFFALVPGLTLASGQAAGQSSPQTNQVTAAAPADPVMPKDANAVMQLAARVNGLASADMKPWHLKANYEVYDVDGTSKYTGTFEEWWAAPDKYKVSFSDPGFHQVEYANGQKMMMTGDATHPLIEGMLESELTHPLSPVGVPSDAPFRSEKVNIGSATLKCLQPVMRNTVLHGLGAFSFDAKDAQGHYQTPIGPIYAIPLANDRVCLEEGTPIVRAVVARGGLLVTFNQVIPVSGHYVAKEFWVKNGDLPMLHGVVQELDGRDHMDDALFEPPSSAVAITLFRVSTTVPGSHYPPHADKTRAYGMVIIEGSLTKTGELRDLRLVSGPPALLPGAMKDAEEMHFPPVKINDQPISAVIDMYLLYHG